MFRHKAHKKSSHRAFNNRARKTHSLNLKVGPGMRGGIRL